MIWNALSKGKQRKSNMAVVRGVFPKGFCASIKQCFEGCLVSRNPDWIIKCENNFGDCEEHASPSVACIWGDKVYGGNFTQFNFNYIILYCLYYIGENLPDWTTTTTTTTTSTTTTTRAPFTTFGPQPFPNEPNFWHGVLGRSIEGVVVGIAIILFVAMYDF
jgi:hypothetical protein